MCWLYRDALQMAPTRSVVGVAIERPRYLSAVGTPSNAPHQPVQEQAEKARAVPSSYLSASGSGISVWVVVVLAGLLPGIFLILPLGGASLRLFRRLSRTAACREVCGAPFGMAWAPAMWARSAFRGRVDSRRNGVLLRAEWLQPDADLAPRDEQASVADHDRH